VGKVADFGGSIILELISREAILMV